ncbi:MAG TPA: VPDSG-CTERM-specific exosortase XrtC [Bradyrhizobium sp.]|nr:VPDSG-CTERM-specific exosortase XrtC [Bradyrhizobium sp.]
MNDAEEPAAQVPPGAHAPHPPPHQPPLRWLAAATLALVLCFSRPLYALVRFALQSDLYSHIVLVPLISAYLVWLKRQALPPASAPRRRAAATPLVIGLVLLAGYWIAALSGTELAAEDSLALTTLSFLMFFGAICALFLGKPTLRAIAFPLGFLAFMVPIPVFLTNAIETFLQYGSAAVAFGIFKVVGTPVMFRGLSFQLPGFNMEVAPQCSGIHSSLALLITSLLAAYFFLRRPWKRAALALAVVPLAMLRNGLRVFVIGELCVHIGPEMSTSYIHRHGGPLFFVLSLIPFFLLLLFLMKSDQPGAKPAAGKLGA